MLFTVIEIVTMVAWLALVLANHPVFAVIVLSGGLFVEHYVSLNVGHDRPPFGSLGP